MATLRAFRPLRYNPAVVDDLAAVVAPPYDVISAAQREALYARDERNVVRLILSRAADPYASAAELLRAWRRDGVLVRQPGPALCYYVEDFTLANGSAHRRTGIIGVVRLEPFATGRIRPHERTFPSAKEDRMRLLRACRTNLSPIFGLFADREDILRPAAALAATLPPDMHLRDDVGGWHQMWLFNDACVIDAISGALEAETVYIADGHHRYETALAYSQQMRAAGASDPDAAHNYVLMYLTSMQDPGLVILPTHRILQEAAGLDAGAVLARLRQHFRLTPFARSARAEFCASVRQPSGGARFGVVLAGGAEFYVADVEDPAAVAAHAGQLHPVVRALDVTVVDTVVVRGLMGIDCTAAAQDARLTYTHDDASALAAVEQGARAAFLMSPPRIGDLEAVCRAGQTMPEKSTYFYPKLLTGLVFHPLEEEGKLSASASSQRGRP
jgi:uncharacterized protein (DUF1015 family)